MKDNKYAPVIIPTLNRFEHFKRCLESLEHCTGAEYTDVYVALDYPPSECYRVGWEMINSYLTEKESEHGFSHLFVIRRSSNYGICKQDGNYELILKDLSKISDRYIFTEDDNEFSTNFLEYLNWGLETYKDDMSVFAICSCKDIDTNDIKNNVYKLNTIFNAWGYGSWFNRYSKITKLENRLFLLNSVKKANVADVFKKKVKRYSSMLYQVALNTFHFDMLVSLLPKDEKWCVFPKVNKVRNWGWDGTGTHGGSPEAFKKYSTLPIDKDEHFSPLIVEDLFNPIVLERFYQRYKTSTKSYVRAAVTFLCYKLTGCIPVANKKSKWLKVKLLKVQ